MYSFILFMHVFIDLSIYLSMCLSIYGLIYLSMCVVYTSHCLSASLHRIYLPAYPFLSVCPPTSLPVCLCACLPPCVPACLSACLPASLPPCLPASLPACLSVRHVFCTNVSLNVRLFIYVCTEVGRQVGVSTDVCMVSKNNVFKGCNICNAQQRSSVCVLNPRTLYCMLHTLHRFLVL